MIALPLTSICSGRMEDGAMSICYREVAVMLFQNILSLTLGITIMGVPTRHFVIGLHVDQMDT